MNKQEKQAPTSSAWKAVGLVGAIGIDLAVFTLVGFLFGRWMDEKMGGSGLWVGLGVLIGLVLGAIGIYVLVRKVLEGSNE
ncbi:AtpZ/AtpI family protein [Saccharibacillus sp. JS10]|uniref:AtpZ/AtpI family protein n=1 Tax=Saccharibacillus sp. JS10 TaxID=2950552 RepID=UPI00210B69C8|nr:AtpZ/AtpI family protein [Saccharibacillus sp. JS10]MCQ4088118.1 AtpZ/AtpI family protein [Saccharibacillus sp. JS10]